MGIQRLKTQYQILKWYGRIYFNWGLKRTLDLCLVIPGIVVLSPLFLYVAYRIKKYDGGPILYWQKRVGWDVKEFDFPKFRSMVINSDEVREQILAQNQHGSEGVTFKMKDDPRITPIGKFIRRYSIDELPQLWCVLKGEMTIVGPRPPLPSEVEKYTPEQHMRLMLKPGLTCLWQINGRSNIPFDEQFKLDMEYMRHYNLLNDIKIILKTIPAILKGDGAY